MREDFGEENEIDLEALWLEMNMSPREMEISEAADDLEAIIEAYRWNVEFWFRQCQMRGVMNDVLKSRVEELEGTFNSRMVLVQMQSHKKGFVDGLVFAGICALIAVSFAVLVCSHPR